MLSARTRPPIARPASGFAGIALALALSAAGSAARQGWTLRARADGADLGEVAVQADEAGVERFAVRVAGAPKRWDFELGDVGAAWVSFDIDTSGGEARVEVHRHATLPIATADAARAFAELAALSAADGGAAWGVALDGPLLVVDPATRFAVSNRPDAEGIGIARDGVFLHQLERTQALANTAVEWRGTRWSMVLWPLPADAAERGRLLAHEAFHGRQPELGLWRASAPCGHLDRFEGRLWLRLEARALAAALAADDEAGVAEALDDALVLRARRQARFAGSRAAEDALETVEGTAEYTGILLSSPDEAAARARALSALRGLDGRATHSRSFAYATGAALGLALDRLDPTWRERAADASLAALAAEVLAWTAPADLAAEAERRAGRHGGAAVRAEEERREAERSARVAALRERFLAGEVLVLPPERPQLSFDPNAVEDLGDAGQVYGKLWLSDAWGVLEAEGGALVGPALEVRVAAPSELAGRALAGDGWTLALAEGWKVARGARAGEWRLVRE